MTHLPLSLSMLDSFSRKHLRLVDNSLLLLLLLMDESCRACDIALKAPSHHSSMKYSYAAAMQHTSLSPLSLMPRTTSAYSDIMFHQRHRIAFPINMAILKQRHATNPSACRWAYLTSLYYSLVTPERCPARHRRHAKRKGTSHLSRVPAFTLPALSLP